MKLCNDDKYVLFVSSETLISQRTFCPLGDSISSPFLSLA